ncbi:D-alanyl-D-alanine carboxypeptidase/D-alanyl-D-alanine-endopeptidase, partial [Bacteroidetes/Chlorobi group bacterium ChocPot_Mid]
MKLHIYTRFFIFVFTLSIVSTSNNLISQVLFKIPSKDTTTRISPIKELQNDLESIISDNDFSDAFIGVSIIAPEQNEILYQKNENKNFVPASNQKILTTATALRYLGADYKFQTKMYLDGEVNDNGEFLGDIYIRGFGDPSLSDYFYTDPYKIFEYFKKCLDSLGIKSIQGDIIGDDNFFDDAFYSPGWQIDDINYNYSAQINALSILDNKVDITVVSGSSINHLASINIYPVTKYIKVTNNVITSIPSSAVDINAVREPCTNNIIVFGTIPYDSLQKNENKISVTIENPTMYFLYLFKEYLERNKIAHQGALTDIDETGFLPDYSTIEKSFTFFSPKLSEIIKVINRESHNLAAEMLLKTIGRETSGFGSTVKGTELVEKYLAKIGINIKR